MQKRIEHTMHLNEVSLSSPRALTARILTLIKIVMVFNIRRIVYIILNFHLARRAK